MTYQKEHREMEAAAKRFAIGRRYWLDRGSGRASVGLSAGWGEVEPLHLNGPLLYVRDCTDGDVYPVDARNLRREKPKKEKP